jgi:uncharacterized protein YqeY
MSLEKTVNDKIKDAMRAKDEAGLRALRAIKSAILLEKTSGNGGGDLSEEVESKLLQKLAKQRKESIDIFEKQNREDLASKEKEELAVIETFLPEPMSAEDLKSYLEKVIAEVGATSPADMGKVMGRASKELAGKSDGKTISNMVKSLLAS